MVTRPEDLHPALSEAYNAGDLEAMLSLYDPKAAFVIKPSRVTESPAELRAAIQHFIALRGHLTVNPDSFVRSDNVVLVLGTFTLSGRRGDGTPFERASRFADVLRRQPDGSWLIAIDNPYGGD
jgi:ketosteroid isomerase-like protein